MQRARRSLPALLVLAFAILGIGGVAPFAMPSTRPAAAVGWPASTTLLVAEVMTGGASASDEFIEIVNVGATVADLQDVELVYASGAATSATRKVAWTAARPLQPGQHLLAANATGIFAADADATWSSGIAATGGAVALRVIGGAVIDAVGWGDATNAFVEGSPAPAPAASSSIERRPGGVAGNWTDTNGNAADFVVQPEPVARNLAAPADPPPAAPSRPPSATPHADCLGVTDRRAFSHPDADCIGRGTRCKRDALRDAGLAIRHAVVLVGAAGDRDHRPCPHRPLRRRPRLSRRRPTRRRRRRSPQSLRRPSRPPNRRPRRPRNRRPRRPRNRRPSRPRNRRHRRSSPARRPRRPSPRSRSRARPTSTRSSRSRAS